MGIQPGITKRAERGHGAADRLLHADDRAERHRLLHGDAYPAWKNNLFVSALGGPAAAPPRDRGDKVTHQEVVFNQFGRVHDVIIGPDGYLYVTLQLPGRSLSESTRAWWRG